MGTVYKETYTKPLPEGAAVTIRKGQRIARWKDAKGRTLTAKVTGNDRLVIEAATYTAKYRDGSGIVRKVSTGCRDATAAKQVLANLEKRADGVRSGIRSSAEDATIDHQSILLTKHFDAYYAYLETRSDSAEHQKNVKRCLNRLAAECRFSKLADFTREALEAWMNANRKAGMSARTRNMHRTCIVAFANWCIEKNRLTLNPFLKVERADEDGDPRRKRRAMSEAELEKLLDVARRRPVEDRIKINRGLSKGKPGSRLKPETQRKLELLGWERSLIYKTLVLTGLRQAELASLTIAQLELEGATPYAQLNAADEKNGEGNAIPLRADLAADLREWLDHKLATLRDAAREQGEPIPARLPADTPVFRVPDKLVKILNRDLAAAGIPKKDERGRTIDVHALRHTFGTLLSKGGVAPRTAQEAMRHSSIDLTMNVYTDPKLLDIHAALDVLPALPLNPNGKEPLAATGTYCTAVNEQLVPLLVPTSCKRVQLASIPGKMENMGKDDERVVIPASLNEKTFAANELQRRSTIGRYRARTCDPQLVELVL